MQPNFKTALTLLAGIGLGALVVQAAHSQAKPPVYQILEIDMTNPEAYAKEYAPVVQPAIKAAGGRLIAGGKAVAIEGEAAKTRLVIQQWDSMEKLQAWISSAASKDARKIGDKYAKFRVLAVEGVAP